MATRTSTAPYVGQVVLVLGAVARHNGAEVAPGIVTRVLGDEVNVTVLPDGYMPRHATGVRVVADEKTAQKTTGTVAYPL